MSSRGRGVFLPARPDRKAAAGPARSCGTRATAEIHHDTVSRPVLRQASCCRLPEKRRAISGGILMVTSVPCFSSTKQLLRSGKFTERLSRSRPEIPTNLGISNRWSKVHTARTNYGVPELLDTARAPLDAKRRVREALGLPRGRQRLAAAREHGGAPGTGARGQDVGGGVQGGRPSHERRR